MRDRLLTFALAIGAFVAFYALFAPKPAAPRERPTRPVSTEAGPNGYLGLQRWLAGEHITTLSLRERYTRLRELTRTIPKGNLLISTTPHLYPMRRSEARALRDWVASGNTLLVVAGLSDTPDWSVGEGEDANLLGHMTLLTGMEFIRVTPPAQTPTATAASPSAAERKPTEGSDDPSTARKGNATTSRASKTAASIPQPLAQPERFESVPVSPHPLTREVHSILAISEYSSLAWRAISDDAVILELTRERRSAVPTLWLRRYGYGEVIVSAFASIFTNKALGERDNARLLANIVARSLGPQGRVIIDDAHQGLVSFYDPERFFADGRLHRSLVWLLGLWLVFVIGPQRLRPATSAWNPLDITSFVHATGGLIARVVTPVTAGRQLFANFFNEIREQLGLPLDGAPVWEWIETHAGIAPRDLARLEEMHGKLARKRRVDLIELHNLLVSVRAQWR